MMVAEKKLHAMNDGEVVEQPIHVCQSCVKKYMSLIFDTCDKCGDLYEIHAKKPAFQVIDGMVYCPPCVESYISKH